ncbi:enoyl-CoA hydratase-related protein [Peristeroidobacter soli]|uniref:enoyl-CoA hydratase-related protein n=1 Tax=Peristeroidobacter soli TaxID=2497877 RepID=UPI00101CA54A|nr:enoyl-CoA hydratase-related protein [Peristeroidobacter soli]
MNEIHVDIAGKIATVTLNKQPVNALTGKLYEQLGDVFETLSGNSEINCAILRSASVKAFCAGKDLKEFLAARVEDDPANAAVVRRTFSAILNCAVPVIAEVNGPALGAGAVIASVCDIRVASRAATFALPEINVGRCGGGAHLGRLIPQGALRRMFFTGLPIDATEAHRIGLVDVLVEPDELQAAALELAKTIAAKSPLGLRIGKKALRETESLPLEEGYAREQRYSTELMHTEDAREATRAVVEKRAPVFVGR